MARETDNTSSGKQTGPARHRRQRPGHMDRPEEWKPDCHWGCQDGGNAVVYDAGGLAGRALADREKHGLNGGRYVESGGRHLS